MALLGNLTGSAQYFSNELFYKGVATQSLRFDDGSSAYLTFTPSSASSATDRRKVTHSFWVKRGLLGSQVTLYSANRAGGGDYYNIVFNASDEIQIYLDVDSGGYGYKTSAKYRDVSAWYNVVLIIDTTQGTDTNRVKLYVNGVLQTIATVYDGGHVAQNFSTYVMDGNEDEIGRFAYNDSALFDGYMSEVILTIGQDNTISQFGELKNGVWIPIEYSGSYGANGVRLQFNQTGVGTASASTIGADTSGNTNHWTSSGIAASDCAMPDSPENNFATGNPLIPIPSGSLSEGNLAYVRGSNASHGSCGTTFTLPTTGKWYWEVMSGKSQNNESIGVANILDHNPQLPATGDEVGARTGDYIYRTTAVKVSGTNVAGGSSYGATYTGGDVIGVAWSSDDGTITFYKNNSSQGTAYSSITQAEGKYVPAVSNAETSSETVFNFGQDSSFAGHKTAQGNTDGNGIGDFYYAPPSGYLALCSDNLPEPTIGPNSATQSDDNFDTLLYTGNNEVAQDIGGLEFKPDFVWIKGRNYADHHALFDSNRGVGQIQYSNGAYTDGNDTSTLDEFRSDGFGVGTDSAGLVNKDSNTYVAWNWKANGGTTTATASEVDNANPAYSQQANPTAGFSIITYTGTGADATIPHGLSQAPELIITKSRSDADHWYTYSKYAATSNPEQYELYLNLTLASYRDSSDNTRAWNATAPTSSVFSIGTADGVNEDGDNFLAYCFHSVEGYSKIGSYVANESTDGVFIYLGFRPAWAMIKRLAGNAWAIQDSVRSTFNPVSNLLQANDTAAEYTTGVAMDFLSNGIKHRNDSGYFNHVSGDTFLYMAFAEAPFKYANGR